MDRVQGDAEEEAHDGAESAGPPLGTAGKRVFTAQDVKKYMAAQVEKATADYERYGFEQRGAVNRLPALQEGELMVLDHVLHPELADVYKRCCMFDEELRQVTVLELSGDDKDIVENKLRRLLKLKKSGPGTGKQGKIKGGGGKMGNAYLDSLPETCPVSSALQVYLVGEDDPLHRTGLIGELGVKAVRPLKALDVLGFYRGYVSRQAHHDVRGREPPAKLLEDGMAAGCVYTVKGEWRKQQEVYSVELGIPRDWPEDSVSGLFQGDNIVVNAYAYGNELCLVNDPGTLVPRYEQGVANVHIYTTLINCFPFAVMVAIQDIARGEDLRYSYGPEYWTLIQDRERDLEDKRETDRLFRSQEEMLRRELDKARPSHGSSLSEATDGPKAPIKPGAERAASGSQGGDEGADEGGLSHMESSTVSGVTAARGRLLGRDKVAAEHCRRSPTPVTVVEWTDEHRWLEDILPLISDIACFSFPAHIVPDPRAVPFPDELVDELAVAFQQRLDAEEGVHRAPPPSSLPTMDIEAADEQPPLPADPPPDQPLPPAAPHPHEQGPAPLPQSPWGEAAVQEALVPSVPPAPAVWSYPPPGLVASQHVPAPYPRPEGFVRQPVPAYEQSPQYHPQAAQRAYSYDPQQGHWPTWGAAGGTTWGQGLTAWPSGGMPGSGTPAEPRRVPVDPRLPSNASAPTGGPSIEFSQQLPYQAALQGPQNHPPHPVGLHSGNAAGVPAATAHQAAATYTPWEPAYTGGMPQSGQPYVQPSYLQPAAVPGYPDPRTSTGAPPQPAPRTLSPPHPKSGTRRPEAETHHRPECTYDGGHARERKPSDVRKFSQDHRPVDRRRPLSPERRHGDAVHRASGHAQRHGRAFDHDRHVDRSRSPTGGRRGKRASHEAGPASSSGRSQGAGRPRGASPTVRGQRRTLGTDARDNRGSVHEQAGSDRGQGRTVGPPAQQAPPEAVKRSNHPAGTGPSAAGPDQARSEARNAQAAEGVVPTRSTTGSDAPRRLTARNSLTVPEPVAIGKQIRGAGYYERHAATLRPRASAGAPLPIRARPSENQLTAFRSSAPDVVRQRLQQQQKQQLLPHASSLPELPVVAAAGPPCQADDQGEGGGLGLVATLPPASEPAGADGS